MSLYERIGSEHCSGDANNYMHEGLHPSEEPADELNDYSEPDQRRDLIDEFLSALHQIPSIRDEGRQIDVQPLEIVLDSPDQAPDAEQQPRPESKENLKIQSIQDSVQNLAVLIGEWLDRYGEQIDQALSEIIKAQVKPESVIICGGQDGHDFEIRDLGDGRYELIQTRTDPAPWYAYQEPGAGRVTIDKRVLDGNDFVPVLAGDRIQVVQVKDLTRFKTGPEFSNWGQKALPDMRHQ